MKTRFGFIALILLVPICGCNKSFVEDFAASFGESVIVADRDDTPPTVTLSIPDIGGEARDLVQGGADYRIDIQLSDRFFIVASAEDPEGVKEVAVVGVVEIHCTNDDGIGQARRWAGIVAKDGQDAGE